MSCVSPLLPPVCQAVYNIITGMYPCSEEEATQLAALQFQAKFGKYNPATYVQGEARVSRLRACVRM